MDDIKLQAIQLLERCYQKPIHTVAAVLVAKNGTKFEGINIDHFSGFICAETCALANAINAGEVEFETIIAVRKEPDGTVAVANPCGKCRQIFHDYCPSIKFVIQDSDELKLVSVENLLPYSFKRQQQKITEVRENNNAQEVVG